MTGAVDSGDVIRRLNGLAARLSQGPALAGVGSVVRNIAAGSLPLIGRSSCGSPKSQRGRATEQNRPRRGCCGERAMSAEGSATGGALWSP